MKIILGSSSPRRKKLLEDWGYDFEVMIPDIDEKSIRSEDIRTLPLLVANAKSEALQSGLSDGILITADSIVIYNNELREKPRSEDEARIWLQSYGAQPLEAIAAVVVVNLATGKKAEGLDSSKVYFHKFPLDHIEQLIQHGAVMDGAGALIIDMPAIKKYIAHIDGSLDSAMGLPKFLTEKLIQEVSNG